MKNKKDDENNKKEDFSGIMEGVIFSNKEVRDYLASGLILNILSERHPDWIKQLEREAKKEIKGLKPKDMRAILTEMLISKKSSILKILDNYKTKKNIA